MNFVTQTTGFNYLGTLACYRQDVSAMSASEAERYHTSYAGGSRNTSAATNQNAVSYAQYTFNLADLLSALRISGDIPLTMTGTFSGENELFYSDCFTSTALDQTGTTSAPSTTATPTHSRRNNTAPSNVATVSQSPHHSASVGTSAICPSTTQFIKKTFPGATYSMMMLNNDVDVAGEQ